MSLSTIDYTACSDSTLSHTKTVAAIVTTVAQYTLGQGGCGRVGGWVGLAESVWLHANFHLQTVNSYHVYICITFAGLVSRHLQ